MGPAIAEPERDGVVIPPALWSKSGSHYTPDSSVPHTAPCCSDHNRMVVIYVIKCRLLFNLWFLCQYMSSKKARIKLIPLIYGLLRISARPGIM